MPTQTNVAQKIIDARAGVVQPRWQRAQAEQMQLDSAKRTTAQWWLPWHDAQLNTLLDLALANNRDIAKARAALAASRALSAAQRANELPQLQAGTHSSTNPEGTRSYLRVGLEAQWEMLLFGARANQRQLAEVDVRVAQLNGDATRFLVTTQVAEHLFHVRASHQRLELLRQQDQLASENLRLIGFRVAQSLAIAAELQPPRSQKRQEQAQLEKVAFSILADEQAISLLTAQVAISMPAAGVWALPKAELASILPLPIAVVRLRPDIALAEQAVYRAGAELGMARTELYPHVALAGAIGAFVGSNGAIHWRPELGPIIDVPLFDWGARSAKVTAQEKLLEIALLSYQQTLQTALGEVELALSKLHWAQQIVLQTKLEAGVAAQSLMQTQQSKAQAQSSQLDVNNAAIALGDAKLAQLDAEEDALLAQIALRLALGS